VSFLPGSPGRDPRSVKTGFALSEHDRAALDAVAVRLFPADETGPGACEAGAVDYIVRSLGQGYEQHRAVYADGLKELAAVGFAGLPADRQDAILAALEREADPFFELVRRHVIEGMFCDPTWGGNAGGAGWDLLGYPGPRHVWTEADQELGLEPRPPERR
jgi:hypothetical protein